MSPGDTSTFGALLARATGEPPEPTDELARERQRAGLPPVPAVVAAQAGGQSSFWSFFPDISGLGDAAREANEAAQTYLRWGTVALIALAVIIVALIFAYVTAPAVSVARRLAA